MVDQEEISDESDKNSMNGSTFKAPLTLKYFLTII